MNTQPEALRLAYVIEGGWDRDHGRKAAAELRRLHQSEREGWRHADELEQERKRLHEENRSLSRCLFQIQEAAKKLEQQLGEAVWNYGEKVRVNQELLEALKELVAQNETSMFAAQVSGASLTNARAAIAKAQEQK